MMNRRSALVVFPALSLVFSASCATASPTTATATTPSQPTVTQLTSSVAPDSVAKSSAIPGALALNALKSIRIAREQNAGYVRTKFRHWVDSDGDGCDAREEVLIAESLSRPQIDAYGCKVVEGDWWSAYDGVTTTSPSSFDIDHFVPLKEAWGSGAWAWTAAKRQSYANDLTDARALIAVSAASNRSKSDNDPTQCMPPNGNVTCAYLSDWVAVKVRWSLTMDESEYRYIDKRLKGTCAGTAIAPWGSGTALGAAQSGSGSSTGSTTGTVATVPASPDTSAAKGSTGSVATVSPGAYCSPVGATGRSAAGKAYVCSLTSATGTPYAGGRAHWRPA